MNTVNITFCNDDTHLELFVHHQKNCGLPDNGALGYPTVNPQLCYRTISKRFASYLKEHDFPFEIDD